jgi:twitching motility protein PilT
MLQGDDLKLAVHLKKTGKVKWDIIQLGEAEIDRGEAESLAAWLIQNEHCTEAELEEIQANLPKPREPPGRKVVLSSTADLAAWLDQQGKSSTPLPGAPPPAAAAPPPEPAEPPPAAAEAPPEGAPPAAPGEAEAEPDAEAPPQRTPAPDQALPSIQQGSIKPERPLLSGRLAQAQEASSPSEPAAGRKQFAGSHQPLKFGSRGGDPLAALDGGDATLTQHTPPEEVAAPAAPAAVGAGLENLQSLLKHVRGLGASDVHIASGSPLTARANGQLVPVGEKVYAPKEVEALVHQALSAEQLKQFKDSGDIDFPYEFSGGGRFRGNVMIQREGWDMTFRVIHPRIPSLDELGLPKSLEKLTSYRQGLVLVTGPGGMGKSTTMAALVELVNAQRHEHIICVEDVIEFVFDAKESHVTQRQLGTHTESFAAALKGALRQDPDVIMVGELRDYATASIAINAAETGHLVFTSMHTASVTQAITRLLDFFPPDEQTQIRSMVSESLRGATAQVLIPRKDGQGRVAACEVLFNTIAVANLIRDDKMDQVRSTMQLGGESGHQLLDKAMQQLVQQGVIDPAAALPFATQKSIFGG